MEQRFVELSFQQSGQQLTVHAPTSAAAAPPGYYLLFVLNQAGTPSVGHVARVGVAGVPDGEVTPAMEDPGNQATQLGTPVTLQLDGNRPEAMTR